MTPNELPESSARDSDAAPFIDRLTNTVRAGAPCGVVGLDPRVDRLPRELAGDATDRILNFYRDVLPRIAAVGLPAVKPNIAFFERYGAAGFAVYEETCRLAREHGLLVIGDIKRGDIGSTAEAYAAFHQDIADAVTVQPWLGDDSMTPFLDGCRRTGGGLFVLVRTSNAGGDRFQGLRVADGSGGTLAHQTADAVHGWGQQEGLQHGGWSSIGAVCGATRPGELLELRQRMPNAWVLVPGVGAQGGSLPDLAPALADDGCGLLINQSRGVLQVFEPGDSGWREAVDRALRTFVDDLLALRGSRS